MKAISIFLTLAIISPITSILSTQQRPTLRTDRQRYQPSEKVVVYYSGLPAGNDYQITIVTPSHSDNAYGTWYPTEGRTEGVMEDFRSGGDGVYEVRIISLNPNSTRTVHARHIFTVGSAVYTPPPKPSPQTSPTSAKPQTSATSGVLMGGTPPLTDGMVAELTEFLMWLLEITLSQREQAQIRVSLVDSWQKNDRAEIEGAIAVLELARTVGKQRSAERIQSRLRLLPDFLTQLRNDKADATSQMLVQVYERQHATTVQSDPKPTPSQTERSPQPTRTTPSLNSAPDDDLAKTIAKRVLLGGPDAKDALLKAISSAGFSVRQDGQTRVSSAEPAQGVGFAMWEVDALTIQKDSRLTMPLEELVLDIKALVPEVKNEPVGQRLLEDIAAAARANQPTLRFWARFIIELGRQSSQPYDIGANSNPSAIHLDFIQTAFILRRLVADLLHPFAEARQAALWFNQGNPFDERWDSHQREMLVRPANFTVTRGSLDCAFSDIEVVGSIAMIGFQSVMNWERFFGPIAPDSDVYQNTRGLHPGLKEKVETVNRWQKEAKMKRAGQILRAVGIANGVLSLAQALIMFNSLKGDITMEDPGPPLVRTKRPRPQAGGERRHLKFKLYADVSPMSEYVNCMISLFNFLGLDFQLPTNRSITGVDTEWLLIEGGGLTLDSDQIVRLVGTNKPTDNNGISERDIEGTPQKTPVAETATDVMKQATVRVSVKIKPTDMGQDLKDALKGPWSVPGEILQRLRLLSFSYDFPVKDWAEAFYFDNVKFKLEHVQDEVETSTTYDLFGVICGSPAVPETRWKYERTWRSVTKVKGEVVDDKQFPAKSATWRGYIAGSAEEEKAKQLIRNSPASGGTETYIFSFDPGPPATVKVWIWGGFQKPREQTITVPARAVSAKDASCN